METVRTWAFSLCAAAVVGAIAELIAPQGDTKKILKVCVSAFFLCCLFSPVIGLLNAAPASIGEELPDTVMYDGTGYGEELFERQVLSAFAENIGRIAREALEESGIAAEEISVRVNIDGDSCISISEIEVTLGEELRTQELRAISAVEKRIGIRPKIGFSGE